MTTLPLLPWLLQSTLILGACWLFYHLLLRRERSFLFNRGLLVLAPMLAALLPLLPLPADWLVGSGLADLSARGQLPGFWLPEVTVGGSAAVASPLPWLLLLYGAGVLLSLLGQGLRLLRLLGQLRGLPRREATGYTLRLTGGRLPTSSFGRTVLWDETAPLTPAEAEQVLRHELTHVRQGHSADRLWLGFWQAVLWFNPFVHLCARALLLTHEYLADAAAAPAPTAAAPAPAYAALLARQAAARLGFLPTTPAHSFATSQTLTRIAMLNRQAPVRRWKQALVLPLLGLLLGVAACEKADQLLPPPPPPPPAPEAPAAPPAPVAPELDVTADPSSPDRVYAFVEQMPEYQGGMQQLMTDLAATVKYPAEAAAAKLEGKVFVNFLVGETGQLRDFKIIKAVKAANPAQQPLAEALNLEALRAVRALPGRWTPGSQEGRPVSVSYTVPITFQLR